MPLVYPSLVFAHVLGAVALFAALAVEAVALAGLRRADTAAAARVPLALFSTSLGVGPPAMLVILASGIWMMATVWGHQAWLVAAFVGLVAMGALGGLVSRRHLRALRASLAAMGEAGVPFAFTSARSRRATGASLRLRIAIGIGVLALMTFKPAGAGSALVLAAAALAGLAASIPPRARRRSIPAEAMGS